MTPYLEIIAREWAARAAELADWAYARLVNRTDVWGSYLPMAKRAKQTFFTAPFPAARGKEFLTKAHLARHFAGVDGHLLSLHSTSADRQSRWIAIDIDRHDGDEESTPHGNFAAALAWHDRLVERGFDPLLLDTNGRGGFHVWIVFAEPEKAPRRARRREKPRVCVDLDGVLAEYSGWQGIDFTGAPLPGAAAFTRRLSEFADVVIFTTRCSVETNRMELGEPTRPASDLAPRLLQKVKYWLDKHDFSYAEIYIGQGKPPASAYVDDRAVRCSPQADPRAFEAALGRVRELCTGAKGAADPRLARIVEAWPSLPEEVRAEIAARVSRPS